MIETKEDIRIIPIEEIEIDDERIDPDRCSHIYLKNQENTLCGIHYSEDKHFIFHGESPYRDDDGKYIASKNCCPVCGWPTCDYCAFAYEQMGF